MRLHASPLFAWFFFSSFGSRFFESFLLIGNLFLKRRRAEGILTRSYVTDASRERASVDARFQSRSTAVQEFNKA